MEIYKATYRLRRLTQAGRLAAARRRWIRTNNALRISCVGLEHSTRDATVALERFKAAWDRAAVKS